LPLPLLLTSFRPELAAASAALVFAFAFVFVLDVIPSERSESRTLLFIFDFYFCLSNRTKHAITSRARSPTHFKSKKSSVILS
jgi:hypothetical protein